MSKLWVNVAVVAAMLCGAGAAEAAPIDGGFGSTCSIVRGGEVECAGTNENGQLGDGSTADAVTSPVSVAGITDAIGVSTSFTHSCAVLRSGGVRCWGGGFLGQLGNGTTDDSLQPVAVSGISTATEVSVGTYHSCAVLREGGVRCWGSATTGQLGNGEVSGDPVPSPVAVTGLTDAVGVSAGDDHTCATLKDGGVRCWGSNAQLALGDGTGNGSATPVVVSGITTATSVIAARFHSCALLAGGTARCWGSGAEGQLGNGTEGSSAVPVPVTGITDAKSLGTGDIHTCVTLATGRVRCWGRDLRGQLGADLEDPYATTPVEMLGVTSAVAVGGGDLHTCVALAGGAVTCAGDNSTGAFGDGVRAISGAPVPVTGLGSPVADLSSGDQHSCAALADGTAACWGNGENGQLGDDGPPRASTPVPVEDVTSAVDVAAGNQHSCATLDDGTVQCWGQGEDGQLGDGEATESPTPVAVDGIADAVAVTAGGRHSCALGAGGDVSCWGANADGQLGDGTSDGATTPVAVDGVTDAVAISAGNSHTCAVLGDGAIQCWGIGELGQLGDGEETTSPVPVDVDGITDATTVSAGFRHTCATLSDGTARCWGSNVTGALGADVDGAATPVAVQGLTGATGITAASTHSCAALATAGARCWGDDGLGQLGNGGIGGGGPSPVPVADVTSAGAVSSGSTFSCFLLTGGTVRCTGDNRDGQLGDGRLLRSLVPAPSGLRLNRAAPTCTAETVRIPADSGPVRVGTCADRDPGATVTVSITGAPTRGSARIEGGQVLYTPTGSSAGTDRVVFSGSDGEVASPEATAAITVDAVTDPGGSTPPAAGSDSGAASGPVPGLPEPRPSIPDPVAAPPEARVVARTVLGRGARTLSGFATPRGVRPFTGGRRSLRGGRFTTGDALVNASATTVVVRGTGFARYSDGRRSASRAVRVSPLVLRPGQAGALRLELSRSLRRALRGDGRVRVSVRYTMNPATGPTVATRRSYTIRVR